jgi:hypothetical protein
VAFGSQANNLVAGDTNECCGFRDGHCPDIFVRDRGVDHPLVLAAHLDIGMPYGIDRGCPSPHVGCGGPFYGFDAGVSTDLVLDAYRAGRSSEIQEALTLDHLANPGRYRFGTARSAEDMRRYFQTNQQLLTHDQEYEVGDVVFFDWDGGGLSDHVGVVTQIDGSGRPLRFVHASGVHAGNPNGRASERDWTRRYELHAQGHGRLDQAAAGLGLDEAVSLLRISVDAPAATFRVYDDGGRLTASVRDDDLIAANVEQFVPFIPGGRYTDLGSTQAISITHPLANSERYVVELTGQEAVTYHVRIESVKDSLITDVEVFTQTITAGETHNSALTLSAQGSHFALSAAAPAPAPSLSLPDAVTLSGHPGTKVQQELTVSETGGQEALQNGVLTCTDLVNQLGRALPGVALSFEPHTFNLLAGDSQTVVVRGDLIGVAPGIYQGSLVIRSDDGPTRMVPLTVDVQFHHQHLPFLSNQ